MTRIPPFVFAVGALLALVVALAGLAQGWAEATPVAFFAFVFFTILAAIRIALAMMVPNVPSAVEAVAHAAVYDSEEQDGGIVDVDSRHIEEMPVAHNDVSGSDVADEHPQRTA